MVAIKGYTYLNKPTVKAIGLSKCYKFLSLPKIKGLSF